MKTTLISTASMTAATRLSLAKTQLKLAEAQKEVTTGRHADVGATLGYKTGQTLSLRQDHARLKTIIDTNSVVSTRLSSTQAALKSLSDDAQLFVGQLIGARNTDSGPTVVQNQAKAALDVVHQRHQYRARRCIPVRRHQRRREAGGRLLSHLRPHRTGRRSRMHSSRPSAPPRTIRPTSTFRLPTCRRSWTVRSAICSPIPHGDDWSAASDQNVKSRISTSELIETSTNANHVGVRKLAMAYAMVADLGMANLNEAAYQAVVDGATRIAGEAVQDLAKEQSRLGTAQERVKSADDRMSIQIDIMANHIGLLEGVDPYEASTRVSALMTQVETAYAMTARIQNLSLLKYLPLG